MQRERRTFLADQQAAAVEDSQSAFIAKAAQLGVTDAELVKIGQSGPARTVWRHLADGVAAGDIGTCEHLTARAPSKVHWVSPGRADTLLCFLCLIAYNATADYTKMPDVGPCGACGAETDTFHTFTMAVGHVLIATVICGSCYSQTRPS